MSWEIDGTFNEYFPREDSRFVEVPFSVIVRYEGQICTTEEFMDEHPIKLKEAMVEKALDGIWNSEGEVDVEW